MERIFREPKIVLTVGTFDLLHVGHINLFERCSRLGKLVVGVNTDEFVTKYKGKPPVIPLSQRLHMIESCKYVDIARVNALGSSLKPLIEEVRPDILAVGSDWVKKDYFAQIDCSEEYLEGLGVTLIYLPYTENISSTEIKKSLNETSNSYSIDSNIQPVSVQFITEPE